MSFKYRMIRARDAALGGAVGPTDYVLCRDLQMNPIDGEYTAQDWADGQEGAKPEELFNPRSSLQFNVDAGWGQAAGTAPRIAHLLKACGMSETVVADTSVTYQPVGFGAAFGAVDVETYRNGKVQALGEVRGSLTFTANSGQRPMFGFNMVGRYAAPQAGVFGAPDLTGWQYAPAVVPSQMQTFTIGGVNLCATQFTFTDGRTPRVDKYMNCAGVDIAERRVTGRVTVKEVDIATKALVEECRTGVTSAIIWELNQEQAALGAMRIAAPRVQIKWGGEVNIEGDMGVNLDLTFMPDQGDDDVAIIFKAQE
ncbi:phage tail tube protein [Tropicimonas sp. S265A]|uniref:phage tail tube protein n=1 Tax=Tropicimonas sp. S265A TaxID=3415134 RepID=UPI003C7CCF96